MHTPVGARTGERLIVRRSECAAGTLPVLLLCVVQSLLELLAGVATPEPEPDQTR